jgi:hypothetical protein
MDPDSTSSPMIISAAAGAAISSTGCGAGAAAAKDRPAHAMPRTCRAPPRSIWRLAAAAKDRPSVPRPQGTTTANLAAQKPHHMPA